MREIKFRAWHTALKRYLLPEEWHHYGPNIISGQLHSEPSDGSPCLIEQFTGLHDKNGREIYEGAIVSFDDEWTEPILDDGSGPSYDYKFISAVIFKYGSFGIKGCASICSLMFSDDFLPFDNSDYCSCNFEVIGNIHENPELLL